MADDLERVRSGLSPLSVAAEKTTTEMITAPLLSGREQRGQRMALPPRVTAPIMEVFKSGRKVRGRLLRTLAMALCGVLLLGGLAWALTQDQSILETSGSEEASSTEEAVAPATEQEVPELYNASETESALADAGLELGDRNEVFDAAIPAGVVIAQDPEAGTTVDEGTVVDIVVSTGPEQVPAALQAAPTGVGSQQPPPAAQPAASKAAGPKQVPAAVQGPPVSVGASSSQEAPAAQSAAPSAPKQKQAPAVQAAPTGVDTGSWQEAPTPRAASTTIQTASSSSVSDKTE